MLHDLIEDTAPWILDKFVHEVRRHGLAKAERPDDEIKHELHDLLLAAAGVLRGHARCDAKAVEVAGDHGEQRARLGYDLRGVLLEFSILRAALLDLARRPEAGSLAEVEELMVLIDASVTEAAVRFDATARSVPDSRRRR